jgi:PilZ domain
VESMKQEKRSVVRKRTQQLVYLELGRDNGGVMLNLSEEGCSFQAITPVMRGETRFAFQISGGRRISGDAEVMWVDDVGIMGGLRFLNLPVEARSQIRQWLTETNAPEERGAFQPAANLPLDDVNRNARAKAPKEVAAAQARQYQPNSPAYAGVGAIEEDPPSAPWAYQRPGPPIVRDDRFAMPMLHDDGSMVATRERSAAVWRGIAVFAIATALAALVVVYQHDVGSSLIWLGEVLSGKTKASVMTPERKPAPANTLPDPAQPSATAPESNSASPKPQAAPGQQKTPETAAPLEDQPEANSRPDAQSRSDARGRPERPDAAEGGRQESMLERQVSRDKADSPEVWNSSESVESLWVAVQGGSVAAERSLAERFVRGDGVIQNCEQAKVLLRAAANRGSREARMRLYELETQGCH